MQGGAKGLNKAGKPTRIADLRASVRAGGAATDVANPPKARKKQPKRETEEERAAKAEKLAMAQHTTSLLKGGNSNKPYLRPGERMERKKGGLFVHLVLVVLVAGGVAVALDPSVLPPEWVEKAHGFISQYIKI